VQKEEEEMAQPKGDAQYPYPNGWVVNVWFPTSKLYNVEVLTPSKHPLHLGGPGLPVLGPLTESKAAVILFRVSRLSSTDSDEQASAKILSE
jgi:hypothetical protein